jgi:hypothetical protein
MRKAMSNSWQPGSRAQRLSQRKSRAQIIWHVSDPRLSRSRPIILEHTDSVFLQANPSRPWTSIPKPFPKLSLETASVHASPATKPRLKYSPPRHPPSTIQTFPIQFARLPIRIQIERRGPPWPVPSRPPASPPAARPPGSSSPPRFVSLSPPAAPSPLGSDPPPAAFRCGFP